MAFSGMGSSGGGGRSRFRGNTALSEMNVVPLVDVVLVLLIIFMVTASVMEFGLQVDVPKIKQSKTIAPEDPVVVSFSKDSQLYLGTKEVPNIHLLGKMIKETYPKAKEVFIRADKTQQWDQVAQIMAAVGDAKLSVKMLTKPEDVRRGQ